MEEHVERATGDATKTDNEILQEADQIPDEFYLGITNTFKALEEIYDIIKEESKKRINDNIGNSLTEKENPKVLR